MVHDSLLGGSWCMGHPGGGDTPLKWGADISDSAWIVGARLDTDAPMMNTNPEEINRLRALKIKQILLRHYMCYAVQRKSIFFLKIHHLFTLTLFLTCRTSSFWQKFDICQKTDYTSIIQTYSTTLCEAVWCTIYEYMQKYIFLTQKAIIRFQMTWNMWYELLL